MMSLPLLFREALAAAGMQAIDEWWAQLDARSRSEALQLWHGSAQSGLELTVRIGASFGDESNDGTSDFWHSDYYEYLVNHEIYLFDGPRFHICTRHPVAATTARLGYIPGDFSCPFASGECPMQKMLGFASGQGVRLRVALVAVAPSGVLDRRHPSLAGFRSLAR